MSIAKGFSIWCEPNGKIVKVITDTLGISANFHDGMQFPSLAGYSEVAKALSFLNEIKTRGMAFNWLINIMVGDEFKLLHFNGGVAGDYLIITGAEDGDAAGKLFEEMMLMQNEQTNALRAALKESSHTSEMFNQISYMNNELVSAQRELAKKNAELIDANARLEAAESGLLQAHARLEDHVAERTAELYSANQKLKRAGKMKDEFLASVSHELRTPLLGILGLADVLQIGSYGPLNDRQNASLTHIQSSGRRLLEMINDILDLSRIDAGKLEIQMAPVSLTDICQASLWAISALVETKGLQSSFSISPEAIILIVDGRRLRQIITNLLSNAVKFTPQGGKLGIQVVGDRAEALVRITVWDTGIGISEQDQSRLFLPFVQLDASLARQFAGSGLGLVLVSRLAELNAGSVSVESAPGQGSRFTVTLPWQEK